LASWTTYFLYTVDDLAQVVESRGWSRDRRPWSRPKAIITNASAETFIGWLETRDAVPLIRSLRDAAERIRRHEMEHAMKLLAKGESPEKVLDQLSLRLTNKFLHAPTQALNSAEGNERADLQGAAARLFHLHTQD
jgi:glutamyl-tRNA reductase